MKSVILQVKYIGSENNYFYLDHKYHDRDRCREFIKELGGVVAAFFITKLHDNENNTKN